MSRKHQGYSDLAMAFGRACGFILVVSFSAFVAIWSISWIIKAVKIIYASI
jgi:hypothetical protein